MSEWQPIETAPLHKRVLAIWLWSQDDPLCGSETHEVAYQSLPGTWCDTHGDWLIIPSYWQPFPAASEAPHASETGEVR